MQSMGGGATPGATPGAPGMPDPNVMQDMMKNPSLSKLLDNPDFLASTVAMLKNPAAKQQIEAMTGQTGMSSDMLIRVLDFLVKCAYGYKRAKGVFSNTYIKVALYILLLDMVLTYLGFINGSFIKSLWPF